MQSKPLWSFWIQYFNPYSNYRTSPLLVELEAQSNNISHVGFTSSLQPDNVNKQQNDNNELYNLRTPEKVHGFDCFYAFLLAVHRGCWGVGVLGCGMCV